MSFEDVRALTFDVFGTVVDWRGSIVREGEELNRKLGLDVDWNRLALAWRGKYGPSMNRVRSGELPWTNLDGLHRMALEEVLTEFGIAGFDEAAKAELNRVWHRLDPWPDAVPGLTRLRRKYTLAPLSNGNVALLTNMAKRAGLPWDCILGAELVRVYKPDPAVYRSTGEFLGLPLEQVMMVAAHEGDLRAAQDQGLRTAFVYRPLEFGSDRTVERPAADAFDVVVNDFVELADRLGV